MNLHPAQIVLALCILSKDASNPTHQLHLDRYSVAMGLGPIPDWKEAA